MPSIQKRLAAGLVLSLIVLLLAQWLFVTTSIHQLSEQYISSRLEHISDLLAGAVTIDASGSISLDTTRIDPIYSQAFSGNYYKVSIGDEQFRSRSLWDETLTTENLDAGDQLVTKKPGPQQQELLILNRTYKKRGQVIQVAVAEDISSLSQDIDQMLYWHASVSALILVLLVILQIGIIRTNLRPLEQVRKDLHKLETGLIDTLNENVPVELFPLVKEINHSIKAVQQRLERSRHSTGNLAHALKGPLSLLTQLANDEQIKNNANIRQALLEHTDTIRNIIERELKRARLAGPVVGAKQARLEPELQALIKSLKAMYHNKSLSIDYDITPNCVTQMDREDLHEMLGNVLDNASKWAAHKIQINIQCEKGLSITVEDDGPGIPEEQRREILSRGQRLNEQTSGHGLGLSVVKHVVDQYHGEILISRSELLAGLKFTINLPDK